MISTLFSSLQETETLLSFWRFVFLQCTDHISFSSCYSIACSLFCISAFGIMHSEATVFRSLGWDPHASHLGMLLLLFFSFFSFFFFFASRRLYVIPFAKQSEGKKVDRRCSQTVKQKACDGTAWQWNQEYFWLFLEADKAKGKKS